MSKIHVPLKTSPYDIIIEKGSLNKIDILFKQYNIKGNLYVFTDSNVDKLYFNKIKKRLANIYSIEKYVLKPGEESKSIDNIKDAYEFLIKRGITRSDTIIGLGGGVVGDFAGYIASTILRGVDFIQIPTTLLAQVDSSVGGKVAVNLPSGKNLVGSFYQPKLVVIDPNVLDTLDEKTFKDGMGEVIKYMCIRKTDLQYYIEKATSVNDIKNYINEIISLSVSIKRDVVVNDEFDKGQRMILNFGHTLGHVIENKLGYGTYSHGECVVMGMLRITKNTEAIGYTKKGTYDKIKEILKKFQMTTKLPDIDNNVISEIMMHDKKNVFGKLNIIALKDIGNCEIIKINYEEIPKYFFK